MEKKWLIAMPEFCIKLIGFTSVFHVDFLHYRRRKKLSRINSRRFLAGEDDDVNCHFSESSTKINNTPKARKDHIRGFRLANGKHLITHAMFLNGHGFDGNITTTAPEQPD
ncbi:hypothetical protein DPMN_173428 [Dreissena polymorpha]|uniref:Uncharacterized protein n=1 Tax=Dreissena polymorpha TaxID=45954 RepID=A0A9D4E3E9_DREPO|nr:hypothetical protein DPMN_173428 [Dreissena polymorpha]